MGIYGQAIVFRNYPGRIWRDAPHRIITSIFYHYLLLKILLKVCNTLITNAYKTPKILKETNWKQNFEKL